MTLFNSIALSIEQCPSFRDQPLGSTSTYNGKCYAFYNNQPMNFESAKRFCEIRGGSLVDETSPALQGFLSWELYRRHRSDPNGQYWLGAIRDTKNPTNWKWINGKDVTISFWNLPGSHENCSRFDGGKGWLWTDTNCNLNLNFICQHRPLSCGKPERPPNATILARNVDIGSIIEYRCSDGNLLVGPNIRTCLPNGFFSEFTPKCKYLECGMPASISNGDLVLVNETRSYLSGVTYSCREGFVLVGRSNLVCDVDERWNGPPPRCEPILCPNPPLLANGDVSLSNNVTGFGTVAQYTCFPGFELVGDRSITCNSNGYWDGQSPFCRDKRPSSTTSTTTVTTTSTTSQAPTRKVTQQASSRPIFINSREPSTVRQPPQIALIPIQSTTSAPITTRVFVTNRKPSPTTISTTPSTTTPTTSTTVTTSTTRRTTSKGKTTSRHSVIRTHENDISDSLSRANSKTATARLNMGGIIALGVFGGFVFLAAVVTIIVIIVRRLKNSRSSIDAQTISTFDSSGDHSGFYRNYQQAWENLRYTGHSAAYKPNGNGARIETLDHLNRNNRGPPITINEGFREANEITLNADVAALYSRPDKRYKRPDPDGQSHWQHRKY